MLMYIDDFLAYIYVYLALLYNIWCDLLHINVCTLLWLLKHLCYEGPRVQTSNRMCGNTSPALYFCHETALSLFSAFCYNLVTHLTEK